MEKQAEQNEENQLNNSAAQPQDSSQKTTRPIVSKKIIIALIIVSIFSLAYSGIYLSLNSKLDKVILKKTSPTPAACTLEAKQCPDGSYVSRTGPNCEFSPCPTTPAPTSTDQSSNWKTYTNTKYGFELKYPTTWKIQEKDSLQSLALFIVTIYGPSENTLLDIWIRNISFIQVEKELKVKAEKITFNGIEAYTEPVSKTKSKTYTFPSKISNQIVQILYNPTSKSPSEEIKALDQILSTFQFTN